MKADQALLLCTCVPFIIGITLCGEGAPKPKEFPMTVPDFAATPGEELDEAVNRVAQSYHGAALELVRQLRKGGLPNDRTVYLVYLLGQLRAVYAVTILIDNIHLEAEKVDPKDRIGRWGPYPAQQALARIGKPAVNMILDRIGKENSELRRKLMCLVICDVDGNEIGRLLLRARLDKASGVEKNNLDLALKYMKEVAAAQAPKN